MERKKEQEIRCFLEKIGLDYSDIHQHTNSAFCVESLFKTTAFVEGDFKRNLIVSLKDVIMLCELYIQKIEETE
jgi:hypothetical protein